MKKEFLSISLLIGLLSSFSLADKIKVEPAFGGERDISYSKYLWGELEARKLNSTPATLYIGGPPHGAVREVLESTVDGHRVIVKRNYGGKDVSVENVKADRPKFLKAVTVMVKKEGFDPKNNDWYWVKYKADGSLHETPKGDKIVGKFPGCIGCHQSASGGDLVFVHNKAANADITLVDTLKK
jgi:hypothetical protein